MIHDIMLLIYRDRERMREWSPPPLILMAREWPPLPPLILMEREWPSPPRIVMEREWPPPPLHCLIDFLSISYYINKKSYQEDTQ